MKKYAKIVDEATQLVQLGVGVNDEYYASIGMVKMDVEQGYDGNWYKKGYAPEESEEHKKQTRILELKVQLSELDSKAIRPLRAKAAGTATEEDEAYIEENELMAEQVRAEIQELENV